MCLLNKLCWWISEWSLEWIMNYECSLKCSNSWNSFWLLADFFSPLFGFLRQEPNKEKSKSNASHCWRLFHSVQLIKLQWRQFYYVMEMLFFKCFCSNNSADLCVWWLRTERCAALANRRLCECCRGSAEVKRTNSREVRCLDCWLSRDLRYLQQPWQESCSNDPRRPNHSWHYHFLLQLRGRGRMGGGMKLQRGSGGGGGGS